MNTQFPKLNGTEEAVRYFVQKMDIDMLQLIIKESVKCPNNEKETFIFQLNRCFEFFKENGNNELNVINGTCVKCYKNIKGYLFIGNHSKHHMNLLFEYKNEALTSIFECSNFKTAFAHKNLNKKVHLDDFNFRFYNTNSKKTYNDDIDPPF